LVRAGGTRLDVRDRVIRRRDSDGVLIYHWQIEDHWDDEHHLEVAVALIESDGSVRTYSERLSIWPRVPERSVGRTVTCGFVLV